MGVVVGAPGSGYDRVVRPTRFSFNERKSEKFHLEKFTIRDIYRFFKCSAIS
jgi:hypothetical protein